MFPLQIGLIVNSMTSGDLNLAQGASPGFEFYADTSRDAAAAASTFRPVGAAPSTNIKPQRLERMNELESSVFPSLHHRKEGWPSD